MAEEIPILAIQDLLRESDELKVAVTARTAQFESSSVQEIPADSSGWEDVTKLRILSAVSHLDYETGEEQGWYVIFWFTSIQKGHVSVFANHCVPSPVPRVHYLHCLGRTLNRRISTINFAARYAQVARTDRAFSFSVFIFKHRPQRGFPENTSYTVENVFPILGRFSISMAQPRQSTMDLSKVDVLTSPSILKQSKPGIFLSTQLRSCLTCLQLNNCHLTWNSYK